MPEQETQCDDEQLRQLAHDVRHCLYVIGMGTEILRTAREDDDRFAEVCELIDEERKTAMKLVGKLIDAAFAGRDDAVE